MHILSEMREGYIEYVFLYLCFCYNGTIVTVCLCMKDNNMSNKIDLTRITIDIPKEMHRRLKARAALQGNSMREIIENLINQEFEGHGCSECHAMHTPNKKTLKAMQEAHDGKNISTQSVDELFKKLGL